MIDVFSSTIVGGIIYDLVKSGAKKLTKDNLVGPLKNWCSDAIAYELAEALEKIKVDEFMSEKAIELELQKHERIIELIRCVKSTETAIQVTQNNSGTGHNISNTGSGTVNLGDHIVKK
ncbi:hypothetical protein B5S52_17230 [Pectobacterium brasiliense]|uniref:hypothetical protein n=1 Tax=Pectobacterium brasiliense TaxID=180957 RepID=UPI0009B08709|nr:hypothetical protein [Pectobacterium brasiliense]ARA77530.1 hypothetical protein B5S52_17230 [Pectobacterium brasiliense]WGL28923.1 hypothetical protein OWC53_04870 [Pectobacterium brasiliense]